MPPLSLQAVEFYLKHGFSIYRDDEEFPLLRLELQENRLGARIVIEESL